MLLIVRCFISQVFIFLLTIGAVGFVHAKQTSATVVSVQGQVETRVQQSAWQAAQVNQSLSGGDEIQTKEGKSTLLMADESMLKLNRNTYLQVQAVGQTASWQTQGIINTATQSLQSVYRLFTGNLWLRNNNAEVDVEVETPTVTASLRGTELNIEVVSAELVNITVLEGAVEASNSAGSITAVAGEVIIAALGQTPRKQTLLSPQDSVQWTVRTPNIIESEDWLTSNAGPEQQQSVQQLFDELNRQDIAAAEQRLNNLQDQPGIDLAVLRGLVDMSAGRHSQAQREFAAAAQSSPQNVAAWRGLALSGLLTNDKTTALEAAERAVELQKSATDWLLLSNVQRALFDLPAAEASAQKALQSEPDNLLALTQLGLLQFADDRTEAARQTAEAALAVDNQDSLAHSLLGFIQLSERDQEGAARSFSQALELDPANSEAHLGQSLLHRRLGNNSKAQQSLATAIALEPQRSLFLSYWAKALHQEQRFDKALTVLDSARRLDAQDPTPHYYQAIIERDLFRAGEAIKSLESAIALNDQRAVYRSRLLLDQDMAARNVNLAGIYGALGMNLLATQKAVQSSMDDFRNFSAHLFLSSVLSEAGRDFPAGSEVLVSGLLLPANANSLSSVNDYTTFFEGPEIDSNITVAAGNHGSLSASASLAGVLPEKDIAYGLIASHSETDGWAGDNGGELSSFAGTLKWQASNRDSFRARISLSEAEQAGGFFRRFEIDRQPTDELLETSDVLFDLGYRRELSHRSDLLLNLVYRETEFDTTGSSLLLSPPPDVSLLFDEQSENERETLQLQGQYSLHSGQHQLFLGAIHLSGDNVTDFTQTTTLVDAFGNPIPVSPEIQAILDEGDDAVSSLADTDNDIDFTSLYVDDVWQVNEQLTLQLGAYFEDFDDGFTDESELNPRVGLVWQPTQNDIFRIAGFRYLLPQVQARLHPTHTGGVFITRNTEEGALVEEFNLIWERSWQGGLLSLNAFDLDRELTETRDPLIGETTSNSSLQGISIGVNQLLNNRWALSAGIGASEIQDDFVALQTARDEVNAAVTLSYVSPQRITASVTQLFRHIDFVAQRDNESIAITDLSLSYTFADRQGSVALLVSNLFDEEFNWVTDAFTLSGREPARSVQGVVSWNF